MMHKGVSLRKVLSALAMALVVALLAIVAAPAKASAATENARYLERSWSGSSVQSQWKQVSAEVLDDIDSDHYTLSGWYVVKESFGDGDRPTVSGTCNIILNDGLEMSLRNGIHVPPGATLNIYAGGEAESGKLLVDRSEADTAAIGGNSKESSGTINIHGATIDVRGGSRTNHGGAGIGGGWQGNGTVRIFGGTVRARGGNEGAGIGGGSNKDGDDSTGGGSNSIQIYGGTVNAEGWWGAGIGGGEYGKGGNIKVLGGDVTAVGGADAAGIGGGEERDGGTIEISGGKVTATGGSVTSKGGAGIGGGGKGGSGKITISGGAVSALGGVFASGVGGGDEGEGNDITISGGYVTATGNTQSSKGGGGAAGVGGGDKAAGKNITISGGTVSATGGTKLSVLGGAGIGGGSKGNGENITISGSANIIKAQGAHNASGIGGGDDGEGKNIIISGGTVTAKGGNGGAGIGGGDNKVGKVTITGGNVTASSEKNGAGIGGGEDAGGNVTISGNTTNVKATGGEYGAGIGSGDEAEDAGTVVIQGGTVVAKGGAEGAGIGGGDKGGRAGQVTISGGNVTATGGDRAAGIGTGRWSHLHGSGYYAGAVGVTISGGKVTARGTNGGAGIGGGLTGPSGKIVIQDGVVDTKGGDNGGAGIGAGRTCLATDVTTTDITISGGHIKAAAGDMNAATNNKEGMPGAAIGIGGPENSASVGGVKYASYFVGDIWLSGGTIEAYSADVTKSSGTTKESMVVIGTSDAEERDWYSKGFVHFNGSTVDMYPGAGSPNGTIKQMVRASELEAGGIQFTDSGGKYQRVDYATMNHDVNKMKEAKDTSRYLVLTGAEGVEDFDGSPELVNEYRRVRVESVHRHDLEYALKPGTTDTIVATCDSTSGCDLPGNKTEVQILAPTLRTYRQSGEGISAEAVVLDEGHIRNGAKVLYYRANEAGTDKLPDYQLEQAPTAPGKYWAQITLPDTAEEGDPDSVTAHVVYDIAKAQANTEVNVEVNQSVNLTSSIKSLLPIEDTDWETASADFDPSSTVMDCRVEGGMLFAGDTEGDAIVNVSFKDAEGNVTMTAKITVHVIRKRPQVIEAEDMSFALGQLNAKIDAVVTAPETGGGTLSYALNDDGWDITYDGPSDAPVEVNEETGELRVKKLGTAYVTITAAATEVDGVQYAQTTKDVKVTVTKRVFEPTVTIGSWTYGENPKSPVLGPGSNPGGGEVTFLYKAKDASDYEYDVAAPTQAGDYVVHAVIGETDDYAAGISEPAEFSIAKKPISASVSVESKTYDGTTDATANVHVNDSALIEGDYLEIEGVVAVFINKEAGENKPVVIDTSKVTFSGEGAENYEVTIPTSATATIEKAWALIMADDLYVPVGDPFPELTATVSSPVLWEEIEYELVCDANMDVPSAYEIVATAEPAKGVNANYEIVCTSGKLTVTRPIEVTAAGFNGPYDGEFHGITVDVKNPGIPPLDPSVIDRLSHDEWLALAVWADYAGLDVVVPEDDWTDGEWATWIEWAKYELKSAVENFKLAEVYYSTEELTAENYKSKGYSYSPTYKDVDSNTVYYYVVSFDGQTQSGSQDVVINKADPTVTAPEPVANLRYTGNPQTLITAGSVVGGTMEYSLDGTSWSSDLPAKTEVGSYAILYRVTGDSNHNDVAPTPIIGTIAKALEPGVTCESWTYGSPAKTPVFSDGEHAITTGVTFSYKVSGADDSTYSSEPPTQAGTYTVRAVVEASGTAYDGTYTSEFSVVRKPITATVIAADKYYDGTTDATLVAYVEDEDVLAGDSVTIGVVTGSFADANAGDVKQVNVDQGSAVVSGRGSQNYDVTLPETTVGTIYRAWAAVWADDVTIKIGQPVPDPLTAHVYVPVKGDELVYTLSCGYEQKVGEYEIAIDLDETVVPNCNYEVAVIPGKLTITNAELTVVAEGYAGTYDGQAHGIGVTALPTDANAKVYYSAERDLTSETAPVAGTLVSPTFTDAGTYRVYYCVVASDYTPVIGFKDVSIAKAAPTVKAPTALQLGYTGGSQALVKPGSAQGGTMEYSLDGSAWSTNVPAATNSGAYAVLYRVTGDANHADVSAKAIASTIGQGGSKGIEMYRLYNPNSGEHFYTGSSVERGNLVMAGWTYEGVSWIAPKEGAPVYRLYNPNVGDHHYTMSAQERDMLVSVGWTYEGLGWHSAGNDGVPLWRQYNPNATTGAHNYTANAKERDMLVSIGWKHEGVGWYGVR